MVGATAPETPVSGKVASATRRCSEEFEFASAPQRARGLQRIRPAHSTLRRRNGVSASVEIPETRRSRAQARVVPSGGIHVRDSGASETQLPARNDRSQGVPGFRVGCKKSVSDARFRQAPPVAAGGAHGDLARGQIRGRIEGASPRGVTGDNRERKGAESDFRVKSKGIARGEQRACERLLAGGRRSVTLKFEPFTRRRWRRH